MKKYLPSILLSALSYPAAFLLDLLVGQWIILPLRMAQLDQSPFYNFWDYKLFIPCIFFTLQAIAIILAIKKSHEANAK